MKKVSIKVKITLYIAFIMALFTLLVMFFSINMARRSADNELKETLRQQVDNLYDTVKFEEIRGEPEKPFENQRPENFAPRDEPGQKPGDKLPGKEKRYTLVVPEDTDYRRRGVTLYINGAGNGDDTAFIGGELPEGIKLPNKKAANKITKSGDYFVFARYITAPANSGGVWVVGCINTETSHTLTNDMMMQAMFAIPIIILVAAALGYFITRRAFKPVKRITEAAARIAGGNDLSERLNLGEGKDEISVLASTFDGMLDSIERNFEREKQFTSDASHELRTPVAVIMAESELAMAPNATKEDCVEALSSINRQSRKMSKLLSELLALARADNKCEVLERESFDICELAEMVFEDQRAIAEARDITLTLDYAEPIFVNADRTQIMRVLINLISNGIKYGKDGGELRVELEKTEEGKTLCAVKDNGIGIADGELDKIWNRFYRGDSARTTDFAGSMGLGLSMVKSIVESHGGKVWAESQLAVGSTFYFVI